MSFKQTANRLLLAGAWVCLTACGMSPLAEQSEILGTATYRERMALPGGAEFAVTLEDVSRADAKAKVIGSTRFKLHSGPPIEFAVPYDASRIEASHRYALRARIELDNRLLFSTDAHYPVLTQGAPETASLLLKRVPAPTPATPAGDDRKALLGMYTYTADSGLFTECGHGRRLPVGEEGDNAALQSAYLKAAPEPGASLLAAVEGRVLHRQPMEGDPRPMLIIERFISIRRGNCEARSIASLENTYWKVTAIRGDPVEVSPRQREPHIILHPADQRVSGRGGCNALTGSYETTADQIRFVGLAGTRMACPEGMMQEQALHGALDTVTGWRIWGEQLELLDNQGTVVLEFESRYMY